MTQGADGGADQATDHGEPQLPPPFSEEALFPAATSLASVSSSAITVGWADFGGPESVDVPDGVYDLIVATVGDASEILIRRGPGFQESDYIRSGLFGSLAGPRHSVCLGAFGTDGRPLGLAMAGHSLSYPAGQMQSELVWVWDDAQAQYVDLASDAAYPDDNALLSGTQGAPEPIDQSSYDFNLVFVDYDNDGDLDLYRLHGGRSPYIVGDPSRILTHVADQGLGHYVEGGNDESAAAHPYDEARGVAVGDLDQDGRSDILVAGTHPQIFLNRTSTRDTPHFILFDAASQGSSFGLPDGGLVHGVGLFDYDNDGDLDVVWLPHNADPWRLFATSVASDGTLTLQAVPLDASAGGVGQTRKLEIYPGDYDNDGDLDLFIPNGFGDPGNVNLLLRNEQIAPSPQPTPFTRVTPPALAMDAQPLSSRIYGASWADLDGDGDLDLITAGLGAYMGGLAVIRNQLYELGSTLRYYRVRVVIGGNAHPVGTRVIVSYGGQRQLQEVMATQGFGASPYPDLHFGTGLHEEVTVSVYAPGVPLSDPPTRDLRRPTSNQPGYLDVIAIP